MENMKRHLMVTVGNSRMFKIIAKEIIFAALQREDVPTNCGEVCNECMKCIMKKALPGIIDAMIIEDVSEELVIHERRKNMQLIDMSTAIGSLLVDEVLKHKEES